MEKIVTDTLHEAPYTLDEVAGLLNVTADELVSISLRGNIDRGEIENCSFLS
jgi:hypothetical protein